MFVGAKARAGFRSALRRVVFARGRATRLLRPVLISTVGICLSFGLTASARVGAGAAQGGVRAKTARAHFPLSVRQISVREVRGRIVGAATIVNTGSVPVRSTAGALGLMRAAGWQGNGRSCLFGSLSLAPRSSRRVRFTTPLVYALPVGSGTYKVLICTDIYSQIRDLRRARTARWAASSRSQQLAARGHRARSRTRSSRPGFARVSRSSTASFRFAATVRRSTFECSLDGGPWLACSSPRRYTALVDGSHAFKVRARSPSGKQDPTPGHASWTVDTGTRAVSLTRPVSGSRTNNNNPVFSGAAGTAPGDSSRIKIKVFSGNTASGSAVRTFTATASGGSWLVAPSQPLVHGTYTAQAEQSESGGKTGMSTPSTFTINVTPQARVGGLTVRAARPASTTSTYSIGGSVSGLSGTVVLQDNGGDDLSVTGNGSFTFATPVGSRRRLQRHGQDQPQRSDAARSRAARARSPRRTSPASRSPAPQRRGARRRTTSTGRMVVWVLVGRR